jgi:hypothetical protein
MPSDSQGSLYLFFWGVIFPEKYRVALQVNTLRSVYVLLWVKDGLHGYRVDLGPLRDREHGYSICRQQNLGAVSILRLSVTMHGNNDLPRKEDLFQVDRETVRICQAHAAMSLPFM